MLLDRENFIPMLCAADVVVSILAGLGIGSNPILNHHSWQA
jgi:hypothetical protein